MRNETHGRRSSSLHDEQLPCRISSSTSRHNACASGSGAAPASGSERSASPHAAGKSARTFPAPHGASADRPGRPPRAAGGSARPVGASRRRNDRPADNPRGARAHRHHRCPGPACRTGGNFGKERHELLTSKFLRCGPVEIGHLGSLGVRYGTGDSPKHRRELGMVVAREYMHDVGPIRGVRRQRQQVTEEFIHLRRGRRLQCIECVPKGVPFDLGFRSTVWVPLPWSRCAVARA